MKRYDKYKDSGISWIGEIPQHWEVKRLGLSFKENKNLNSSLGGTEAYKFNYGTLVRKDEGINLEELAETYVKYTLLQENDIVINGLNLNYDFVTQRIALATQMGIITSSYLVLSPRKGVNHHYYSLLFKAMDSMKLFHGMGSGIRLTLSYKDLKNQALPLPPLSEQEAIVSYLEEKTAKIDLFITKKEEQILHLKELREAIIAQAVTRGIQFDVAFRPSGIPWLGDIPKHWEVLRAKHMFIRMMRDVQKNDDVITCFRDGEVTLRRNRRTEGFTESFKEIGYQGIRKGDLVIHQMDAFAGAIGVSDSDGKGTPVYICLQPKGAYLNQYYAHLLRVMARTGYIKALYRGIRERSSDFRYETFATQYLAVPPPSEQETIVAYISQKTKQIDQLIESYRQEIDRIKELKQGLISDAVLGRINVQTE